jgi:hypothetical protein
MALAFFLTVVLAFAAGWAVGAVFGFGAGPAWRRYKKRIIEEYEKSRTQQPK